jgi:uncharacterized membrane protein YbhN (UPF0104 family)
MNFENLADHKMLPNNPVPNPDLVNSDSVKSFVWFQLIVFILGLGLLSFVIYYTGFQTIFEALRRVGWGFLFILALNGLRHLLRALCVYLAIPVKHRKFSYLHTVSARLGGEAVSVLTFTGPLLGEATKATLLKNRVPLSQSISAVVVDNILYDISVILLILSGIGVLLYSFAVGEKPIIYALLIITGLMIFISIGLMFLAKYRIKPITWLIENFSEKPWLPRFVSAKKDKINQVETNVYNFYSERRSSFYKLLGINFLAHALSVCEVYVALYLLGFSPNTINSFIIESLTKVINLVFSFVPGTIGVYEGGTGIILHTLGYVTATGIMLGLIRKGAILFWTSIGLMILLWRAIPKSNSQTFSQGM